MKSIELEQAILGACLLEGEAIDQVVDLIQPEMFYAERHQVVWQALKGQAIQNKPTDIIGIVEALKQQGHLEKIGGAFYLSQLTQRVNQAGNIEHQSRILAQYYMQRQVSGICNKYGTMADRQEGDPLEVLDGITDEVLSLSNLVIDSEPVMAGQALHDFQEWQEKALNSDGGVIGIPSGIDKLDRITKGFKGSDLIIVAGRPGMGKSAFAMQIALNCVRRKEPAIFFSIEMPSIKVITRVLAAESGVDFGRVRDKDYPENGEADIVIQEAKQRIANYPLMIVDEGAVDIGKVQAISKRAKSRLGGLGCIVVDYLQLMKGTGNRKGENREQEIASISRGLKEIAKKLDVPVIALSQFSRAVEQRPDKRPMLSDLRESGAIEQDADMVIGKYRDSYYDILEDENGEPTEGTAEIIILKHRDGELGTIKVGEKLSQMRFFNLDENETYNHF